jgi:hypothetical protein
VFSTKWNADALLPSEQDMSNNLNHDRGRVITAGYIYGSSHEPLRDVLVLLPGSGRTQNLEDLIVVKTLDQAIAAEQEKVVSVVANGADLGVNKLVTSTEGFLKQIAAWMSSSLAFVYLTVSLKPTDVGIIGADLFDAPLACR